jgi:hypothetical protein
VTDGSASITRGQAVLVLVGGLLLSLLASVWTVRFVGHVGDLLVTRYSGVSGVLVFDNCAQSMPPECPGRFRADDGSFEQAGVTIEVHEIPEPRAEVVPAHLERGSGYGYAKHGSVGQHVFLLAVRLGVLAAGLWLMWIGWSRSGMRRRSTAPEQARTARSHRHRAAR